MDLKHVACFALPRLTLLQQDPNVHDLWVIEVEPRRNSFQENALKRSELRTYKALNIKMLSKNGFRGLSSNRFFYGVSAKI